jgi:type IV pilus assembly protein PilA
MIELMLAVGVIAILLLLAVPTYQEKIIRDQVAEALPLADIAKAPIAAAWSAGLPLPDSNKAAGLPPADKIVSNYVSSVAVQQGAIHITFGNRANLGLKGKILTLRPAVVTEAPIVPVAWVCGNASVPDQMTPQGTNKTSLELLYLPLRCRP